MLSKLEFQLYLEKSCVYVFSIFYIVIDDVYNSYEEPYSMTFLMFLNNIKILPKCIERKISL